MLAVDIATRSVTIAWDPHLSSFAGRFHIAQGRALIDPHSGPRKIDQVHLNGVACTDDGMVVNCGLVRPTPSWYQRQRKRGATKLGRSTKPSGAGVHGACPRDWRRTGAGRLPQPRHAHP